MEISPEDKLDIFLNKLPDNYRDANLIFAYYTSFPSVFTPDILHQIWLNFQDFQKNENLETLPIVVVSDILQSNLCQEVGFELFEFDNEVAQFLKTQIISLCKEREINWIYSEKDLASFTIEYAKLYLQHPNRRNIYDIYYWKSIFIINKDKAIEEIKDIFLKKKDDQFPKYSKARIFLQLAENIAQKNQTDEYKKLPVFSFHKITDSIEISDDEIKTEICKILDLKIEKEEKENYLPYQNILNKIKLIIASSGHFIFSEVSLSEIIKTYEIGQLNYAIDENNNIVGLRINHFDLGTSINQIFENEEDWKYLTYLNLEDNKIEDISFIKKLITTANINLSNNKITELPLWIVNLAPEIKWDNSKKQGEGIYFFNNPIENVPIEVVKQGKAAIKDWLNLISIFKGKKIFISYAHKDKTYSNIFLDYFKSKLPKDCEILQDTNGIKLGTDWHDSILNSIQSADIALLLVSPSFISSDFIKEEELNRFIQLSNEKKCLVFPVYFKPFKIEKDIILKNIQIFKPEGKKYGFNEEVFSFSDLVKFNKLDGQIVSNINIEHYINDCINSLIQSYRIHIMNPPLTVEAIHNDFTFAIRNDELKELLSETCPDFLIIKAPSHYGKTYLIKELKNRLEQKWEVENITAKFSYFNFKENTIKNVEREIASLEANFFKVGSYNYLAFDNIDKLNPSDFEKCTILIESIVSRIEKTIGIKLKIILSSIGSIDRRLGEKSKRKFKLFGELSPININVIKLAIEKKCNNLKETLLNQLANDIYNYCGGHPGITVKIIQDIAETNSFLFDIDHPRYYFSNRGRDFVKRAIDEIVKLFIKKDIKGELKYFFIARGLEFGMIIKIANDPTTLGLFMLTPTDIQNELLRTNLFETKNVKFYIYRNHIIRLLIKSYLYNNELQVFKKINSIILAYFDEYFTKPGRNTNEFGYAIIEYFYHLLLEGLYNPKSKNGIWGKLQDKIILRKDDLVTLEEFVMFNIDAEIRFLCNELFANENPPELENIFSKENISNKQNLDLLIDKKAFLEKQLILTFDAEKKFALQEQIKDFEKQIADFKLKISNLSNDTGSFDNNFNSFISKEETEVLFLSANPKDKGFIHSENEFNVISNYLLNSKYKFNITNNSSLKISDFYKSIEKKEYNIIHFSGHNEPDGLIFENKQGLSEIFSSKTIIEVFKTSNVNLLILMACDTIKLANEISKYLYYVIAIQGNVIDSLAINFSDSFYKSLSKTNDIEFSYMQAISKIAETDESYKSIILFVNGRIYSLPITETPVIIQKLEKNFEKEIIKTDFSKVFERENSLTYSIDDQGNVIGLNLADCELNEIPIEVFQIKTLKKLCLYRTQIKNIHGLGELQELTHLWLSQNQIEDISELKLLVKLEVLYIASNPIADISPLKKLINLKELEIRNLNVNDISFLKEIKELQILYASDNQIEDISSVSELFELREIEFRANKINTIPELRELKQLENIDLQNNQITALPEWICDLNLEFNFTSGYKGIWLNDNPLTSPPIEIVKQGKDAIVKYFKNDLIKIKKLEILLNTSFRKVDFSELNRYKSKSVTEYSVDNYENIIGLSIQYLNLTEIPVQIISLSDKLTYLNLSNNKLKRIDELESFKQLTLLDLSNNQIKDIKPLKNLPTITKLYLENNQINDISIIKELQYIEILNLSENKISNFDALSTLKKIRGLYLSKNKIKDISFLRNLNTITGLNLDNNEIEDISSLSALVNCRGFNLGNNKITNLYPLKDLKQLADLWLNKNKIKDISALEGLLNLKKLELQNNPIKDLPKWITNFKSEIKWMESASIADNYILFYNNPLENPPIEIVKQGKDAIISWFIENSNLIVRPKKIEATLLRFQINGIRWIIFLGYLDGILIEFISSIDDPEYIPIPQNLKHGFIVKENTNIERYDFQYTNKEGYNVTIENINFIFDMKIWKYSQLITKALNNSVQIDKIIIALASLKVNDKNTSIWLENILEIFNKINVKNNYTENSSSMIEAQTDFDVEVKNLTDDINRFEESLTVAQIVSNWYKSKYPNSTIEFVKEYGKDNYTDFEIVQKKGKIGVHVKLADDDQLKYIESNLALRNTIALIPDNYFVFNEFHLVIVNRNVFSVMVLNKINENISNSLKLINRKLKLFSGYIDQNGNFVPLDISQIKQDFENNPNFKIRKTDEEISDMPLKSQLVQQIYIEGSFTKQEFESYFQEYANKLKLRPSRYNEVQTNIYLYFFDVETRASANWFAMYAYRVDSNEKFSYNENLLLKFEQKLGFYTVVNQSAKNIATQYPSILAYFEKYKKFNLSNGTLKIISENHFQISNFDAPEQKEKYILEDIHRDLIKTFCEIFIHTESHLVTLTAIPMEISADENSSDKYLEQYSTTITIDRKSVLGILNKHLGINNFNELVESDNNDASNKIFQKILYNDQGKPNLDMVWEDFDKFKVVSENILQNEQTIQVNVPDFLDFDARLNNNVQNLIGQNKTEQAINEMKNYIPDKIIDISLLEAKYQNAKNANLIGTISFQEYMQSIAQINYGLLMILSDEEVKTKNKKIQQTKLITQRELIGYQSILDLLISKKNFLQNELPLVYDNEQKFALNIQIEDLCAKILELKENIVEPTNITKFNSLFIQNNNSALSKEKVEDIQSQFELLNKKINTLSQEVNEIRFEYLKKNTKILQSQTAIKDEIINAITNLTEAQTKAIWTDISEIFQQFETSMDEKLLEKIQQIKSASSLKSKLELSIPFINMLGVDYNVELDIVGWAKNMYEKYELKIFKLMGAV